jgi:hypothetical protein
MRQGGHSFGFLREALACHLVGHEVCGQDLDRDVPGQACVARTVHLTHATRSEWRDGLVRPEPCAGRQCHSVSSWVPRARRVPTMTRSVPQTGAAPRTCRRVQSRVTFARLRLDTAGGHE